MQSGAYSRGVPYTGSRTKGRGPRAKLLLSWPLALDPWPFRLGSCSRSRRTTITRIIGTARRGGAAATRVRVGDDGSHSTDRARSQRPAEGSAGFFVSVIHATHRSA